MCCLMIDVYERALDVRQDFDLVLELLTDVVRFPEWSAGVHDNINLDKVFLSTVSMCETGHKVCLRVRSGEPISDIVRLDGKGRQT